ALPATSTPAAPLNRPTWPGIRRWTAYPQVGVGLDRKAHQVGYAVQRLIPGQVGLFYGAAGVDVAGSAVLRGDAGQGNVFGVQLAVAVLEFTHAGFQFSV